MCTYTHKIYRMQVHMVLAKGGMDICPEKSLLGMLFFLKFKVLHICFPSSWHKIHRSAYLPICESI